MNPTAASAKLVTLNLQGPLARIVFNRSPLNVLDFQMMDELLEALQGVEQRSEICAVVLRGGDRAFSAGVDVAIHTQTRSRPCCRSFMA